MKKKYARLVDVPEVEKGAYNHGRFISGLVMHQLIHMSTVEQSLPEEHRTGTNISDLHTEAEAADYIGKVTAKIHELRGNGGVKKKRSARPKKQSPRGKHK